MPPVALIIAVTCLSIGVLAAIFLPFIAAMKHVTYTLDTAVISAVTGTLLGVMTVIMVNSKKNGTGS
jgi:hypothetical protein